MLKLFFIFLLVDLDFIGEELDKPILLAYGVPAIEINL